jgi:hypothetical protein
MNLYAMTDKHAVTDDVSAGGPKLPTGAGMAAEPTS